MFQDNFISVAGLFYLFPRFAYLQFALISNRAKSSLLIAERFVMN